MFQLILLLKGNLNLSDYDSYYLIPKEISDVTSRTIPDLKSDFHGVYPIFSSPMKGISGSQLVIEMGRNNCFGILHRFDIPEKRVDNIHKVASENINYGVAIGLNDFDIELDIASCAFERGAKLICVDVANGYNRNMEVVGKRLRGRFGKDISLMAGNVVDSIGAEFLVNSGFDFVRIGIGNGGLCLTRDETGIGRNTLMALKDCINVEVNLVCDGGIDKPGKAMKAFAFGANFVMIGSQLGYALEAENDGVIYGMASHRNHMLNKKDIKSVEGKDIPIDNNSKKPLKEILDRYLWGIKSSCTYLNCNKLSEILTNSRIIGINE